MAFKFGATLPKPAPVGETSVLPDTKETQRLVETHVRMNEAEGATTDAIIEQGPGPESIDAGDERITGAAKLTRLVSEDFPFDESQLAAIEGIANQRFACLTGAAGTGKTTSTKAIVDRIQDQIGLVDMTNYFGKKNPDDAPGENEDDDYEMPETAIPSICLVGFTGRSAQMIKKNFPRDWHSNIMTIHRMLAFAPEFYDAYDEESGEMKSKMRFVPQYTRFFKLPWDVIVIDEAGMVSIELWEMVWAAAKEGCRIIMIGDINQLPPVHGRSIFGFAMTKWPSWELTHIHRQIGVNNSIVDNAWKILKGQRPESDNYQSDPGWKFAMMPIPEDSALASRKIRKWLEAMNGKAYQPHRDSVITAINAEEGGNGYALGQIPMNRELAIVFNKDSPRYIIDAGRERKQFAVGDKVMATRNDHEAGITNGMTGIITNIERNAAYTGDWQRFGITTEVAKYMDDVDEDSEEDFSLTDLSESMAAIAEGQKNKKESRDRGPASHIVTVRFGDGEHSFEIPFATLAEVASLMVAYVVTCHKMQGGESPLVIIICHQAHKQMLNREWLYTAVTRASQKCVLFFTDMGLRAALSKQRIKGHTLAQKVEVFQALQTKGLTGAAVQVDLPEVESLGTSLVPVQTMLEKKQAEAVKPTQTGQSALLAQIAKAKERQHNKVQPEPVKERVIIVERTVHHHHHAAPPPTPPAPSRDGGDLQAAQRFNSERLAQAMKAFDKPVVTPAKALPAPTYRTAKPYSTLGYVKAALELSLVAEQAQRFLPKPAEEVKPVVQVKPKFRFGGAK